MRNGSGNPPSSAAIHLLTRSRGWVVAVCSRLTCHQRWRCGAGFFGRRLPCRRRHSEWPAGRATPARRRPVPPGATRRSPRLLLCRHRPRPGRLPRGQGGAPLPTELHEGRQGRLAQFAVVPASGRTTSAQRRRGQPLHHLAVARGRQCRRCREGRAERRRDVGNQDIAATAGLPDTLHLTGADQQWVASQRSRGVCCDHRLGQGQREARLQQGGANADRRRRHNA